MAYIAITKQTAEVVHGARNLQSLLVQLRVNGFHPEDINVYQVYEDGMYAKLKDSEYCTQKVVWQWKI